MEGRKQLQGPAAFYKVKYGENLEVKNFYLDRKFIQKKSGGCSVLI